VAPDFPVQLVAPDGDVDAQLREGSGIDWFELDLGVMVDGARVDLVPSLVEVIARGAGREGIELHPDDEPFLVPLPGGRLLRLPMERLRPILPMLADLFSEGRFGADDGALRFARQDAAELVALEEASGLAWQGAERLRGLGRQLRAADGAIPLLSRHLDRMEASALWLGFRWDRADVEARIAALPPAGRPQRLRLLAARSGRVAIQLSPLPPSPAAITAGLARRPVAADDWRLFHKTSDRAFLDDARIASGLPELLFHDGEMMAEGRFPTLFLDPGDGIFITPPVARGLLPGVLRAELLATGRAVEGDISIARARAAAGEGRLWVGNAVRGLMRATLAGPHDPA
jgi:branched-subunit amino acid aminotransferase/4-amino-4-deoxychorismate lyase